MDKQLSQSEFAKLFKEHGMKGYDKGPMGDSDVIDGKIVPSKNMKKTKNLEIDAQIDLHGQTILEALSQLTRFISVAKQSKYRKILVICGKGNHSLNGEAKLRPAVTKKLMVLKSEFWLRDFEIAQPKDGGYGALYVYL